MGDTDVPPTPDDDLRALAEALPAYEFGPVLGRGAFAVVYGAHHVRLERDVAVKLLSTDVLADAEARSRFAAEARLLAKLDHPHVVRVFDYVEREGVCALVMERLRGGTLANRLRIGPLPRDVACAVMIAALYGLEIAHRHGVLHRDVKPDNLLFGQHDLVKVTDFGIAKVLGSRAALMTATGASLGTPAFMAPEQVSSSAGALSTATDVYAAGAVLYELLSHQPVFPRDKGMGELLFRRMTDDPPPLHTVAPDLPAALADAVMGALARDPMKRYPTAAQFAAALETAVGAAALTATRIPIHRVDPLHGSSGPTLVEREAEPGLQTVAATGGLTTMPPDAHRRRRRGAPRFAILAAVVAIAVTAGLIALLSGGESGTGKADAARPAAPPGWPAKFALGYVDQVKGVAGAARLLGNGGMTIEYFGGDAAAGTDWSRNPKTSPARFVRAAAGRGQFPFLGYYQLRSIGRTGRGDADAAALRRTFADPRLMRLYWFNVRRFLKSLGSTGKPAAVSLESGVWPLLQQDLGFRSADADTVRARVALSGLNELQGVTDTLGGVATGWKRLRDRYAPKVLLGYAAQDYGTNIDFSKEPVSTHTTLSAAREMATFFLRLEPLLDFVSVQVANAEAGAGGAKEEYTVAERDSFLTFLREFTRIGRIPVVLEGVPLGNTVSRAISDKPYHWRDHWVEWLLGGDDFARLRRLRDDGVIGVYFGVAGGEYETCPCDAAKDGITNDGKRGAPATSADDDGGYFAARVRALRRAGGLSLQ